MSPSENPRWIKSKSLKATEIREFLNVKVMRWRRRIDKDSTRRSFFLGCYGNPDRAEMVFVPEVPSSHPNDLVELAYPPESAWKSSWKVTDSDLLFRIALTQAKRIPYALSDEPWEWSCWVTDFVKSGSYTGKWKTFRRTDEGKKMIRESAGLLEDELGILRPKSVIFVGGASEAYFIRHLKSLKEKLGFKTAMVPTTH